MDLKDKIVFHREFIYKYLSLKIRIARINNHYIFNMKYQNRKYDYDMTLQGNTK